MLGIFTLDAPINLTFNPKKSLLYLFRALNLINKRPIITCHFDKYSDSQQTPRQCANSRNSNSFPQVSYIRNEFRISCLQTGHLGVASRSTEIAHSWQHTRCPHGMNADRLLLIRQITHNSPSGTSPVSSSDAI